MNLADAEQGALVLVDFQQRLLPALHRGDEVLAQALRLAQVARELGLDIIGTEQNPHGLGPNVEALRALCDTTLPKMHFDACADGLLDALREGAGLLPHEVVLAGCEAHVCLMQTALGLRRAGLRVWVAADACGSRRPNDHMLAMQRLQAAGVGIVSVEMVAFEWLRSYRHERFKAVLDLVK